jgi:hypothetical protein
MTTYGDSCLDQCIEHPKVLDLLDRIHRCGMEVFPCFHGLSLAQHQRAYNGVGPEKFGDVVREVTTAFFWRWEADALIHDDEYTYANDGTREGWRKSNERFWRNGLRGIREDIPWWRFLTRHRLYTWNQALFLALCTETSWQAWLAAYEKQKTALASTT